MVPVIRRHQNEIAEIVPRRRNDNRSAGQLRGGERFGVFEEFQDRLSVAASALARGGRRHRFVDDHRRDRRCCRPRRRSCRTAPRCRRASRSEPRARSIARPCRSRAARQSVRRPPPELRLLATLQRARQVRAPHLRRSSRSAPARERRRARFVDGAAVAVSVVLSAITAAVALSRWRTVSGVSARSFVTIASHPPRRSRMRAASAFVVRSATVGPDATSPIAPVDTSE